MKREPSIHITESNLRSILEDAEIEGNLDDLVKFILTKASKHKLNHRIMLASNQTTTKKAVNVLSSSSTNTAHMIKAITMVRRSHKHRGLAAIRPGTREYTLVKTIAANAELFYQEYFEEDEKIFDAFVQYIELAFKRLNGKFNLTRLPGLHDSICSSFEALAKIAKDNNSEITQKLLKIYNQKTVEKTGTLFIDYSKVPDKYTFFIQAADICKRFGVSAETFMEAQFVGWEWAEIIPEPYQLANDKAMMYLQKYLYKNPEKAKRSEVNTEKINRFKNIGKNGSNRN